MRLVCPNCDAEYEIDGAAIPKAGRDVQCSNCGHAWYQNHPEAEADLKADRAEQPPVAVEPDPVTADASAVGDTELPPADEKPLTVNPPKARTLDETVLAVLREEAERESAARRADAAPKPVIETQTELPLAQDSAGMAAAVRRIARMRGVPEPEVEAEPPTPPKSRSQMLPAIEEINSTLRSTNSRTSDEDSAIHDTMGQPEGKRGGFRRGFLTLIGLALLIVVLYVLAPVIRVQVPAMAGAVDTYVATVNSARIGLDAGLRSLVGTLRGLAGGQNG